MVLGRHHHVLLTGALGQPRPFARGSRLWLEVSRQNLVLRDGNALRFHHPLLMADDAVQAPVDKHPELRFVPPAHALRARVFLRLQCSGLSHWNELGCAVFLGCRRLPAIKGKAPAIALARRMKARLENGYLIYDASSSMPLL